MVIVGDRWIIVTTRGRGVIGGGYIAPLRVSDIEFVENNEFGNRIIFW